MAVTFRSWRTLREAVEDQRRLTRGGELYCALPIYYGPVGIIYPQMNFIFQVTGVEDSWGPEAKGFTRVSEIDVATEKDRQEEEEEKAVSARDPRINWDILICREE